MNSIDLTGGRGDIEFRKGDTFLLQDDATDSAGNPVTPTSMHLTFRAGTLTIPGDAVGGVSGTVAASAGTVTWGIATAAETRMFSVGGDYVYAYDGVVNGMVLTLVYGKVTVLPELT